MILLQSQHIMNIQMGELCMQMKLKIIVFASPNDSGKSTITGKTKICGKYINVDIIKKNTNISKF